MRTSILLQSEKGKSILVDTTPDLRTQCLNNQIESIDAVIITHDHADHLHGIDDLRPFNFRPNGKVIPLYTFGDCAKTIKNNFAYIFKEKDPRAGSKPQIEIREVDFDKPVSISGEEFQFFLLPHGPFSSMGFKYHTFAYLIDCSDVPENIILLLKKEKLEILILDCVQIRPHKTHLYLEKSFELIKKIRPKTCGLIHMNHELEHRWLQKECKRRFKFPVFPVFDGQKLKFRTTL
jgi:phosphoribosyl 1,2-cyclic phosphate phosphodiesterase